jgi:hypothetical protein
MVDDVCKCTDQSFVASFNKKGIKPRGARVQKVFMPLVIITKEVLNNYC